MPETPDNPKPQVTLEQLLQVKRLERPDPAFWEDFDSELHRRQLAALVDAQPWHARLGRGLLVALRRTLPIGAAAAAVAAGFFALDSRTLPAVPAAQTAQSGHEPAGYVVLPEENVFPAAAVARERVAPAPTTRAQPRYVMQELASAAAPARSFITVSSPHTLSAAGGAADIYVVNTLTTGPALRAPAIPAGSF